MGGNHGFIWWVLCLSVIGVAFGVFFFGLHPGAFLAPIFGGIAASKSHFDAIEKEARQKVLDSPTDAIIASLDPDTQRRISDAEDDAVADAWASAVRTGDLGAVRRVDTKPIQVPGQKGS